MGVEQFGGNDESKQPRKGEFTVGAEKNPDGTWDMSRAAVLKTDKDFQKKWENSIQENKDKTAREREENLKIPDDIRPGTEGMVSYRLKNASFVAREQVNREKQANPGIGRASDELEKRLQDLLTEREILEQSQSNRVQKEIAAAQKIGLDLSSSDAYKEVFSESAAAVAAEIDEWILWAEDRLEQDKSEGHENSEFEDRIAAAKRLASRLYEEAPRGNT